MTALAWAAASTATADDAPTTRLKVLLTVRATLADEAQHAK
jgi:hypothetical protein